MVNWRNLSVVLTVTALIIMILPPNVAYGVLTCGADVTQHQVAPNSLTNFQFNINNTGDEDVVWIKVTRPSANFDINNSDISGWNGSTPGDDYTIQQDGSLLTDDSLSMIVTANTADVQASSAPWRVEVSSSIDGSNPTDCTGSLGTEISGSAPDTMPPNVYNISVSNLRTSSVTITWTTDEPATSLVNYGFDELYGDSTNEDASLKTSHNATLMGLTANQAYHFQVISRDGSGNEASSGDNTFLTPLVDPSSDPSTDNTTTSGSGFLKTKIPLKDVPTEKIPPVITLTTNLDKPFKQVPVINGTATDNEALAGIEYSVDGGVNWLQVDNDKGLGTKNATFSFKPLNLEDGNYPIIVRAIDTSRNIGLSDKKILVIDRLPPQVGGSNISAGPQIFQPNEDGVTYSLVGVDQKITFSAVGGATQIIIDAKGVFAKDPSKTFNLTKSPDTGLWSGIISFDKAGEYILTANSVDGAGNKTAKVVSTVQALQPGRIISKNQPLKDAEVVLYYQEPTTNTWTVWDGASYGQTNPQKTDAQGQFNLFVPPGKYYLKADAKNHRTLISNIFETKETMPILSSLSMKESRSFKVANKTFHIPSLLSDTAELKPPRLPLLHFIKPSPIVNKQISDFTLQDLNGQAVRSIDFSGKPTVITFISSWSPSAKEQLAVLSKLQENKDINIIPIVAQEGPGKIKSTINISGLRLDMLIDPDGVVVNVLNVQSLPSSYVVDRRGVIKKVMVGVLSEDKIINALEGQ